MVGLTTALNSALTGLNVNQQALSVLSQNISNANTPGYSRETLNQQAVYLAGTGEGVTVDAVTRKVDTYLLQSIQTQNSVVSQSSTLSDYASRIQLLMGTPGSDDSLDTNTTTFFNDLQSLAQTPQGTTQLQDVLNSATSLTSQVNQLASGLEGLRYQADQDINTSVSSINQDLQTLYNLNANITNAQALGQSTAGLEDTRDTTLQDLSQYLDIQTTNKSNGQVDVESTSGVSLLDDNLYQLNYTPASGESTFTDNGTLSPLTVQRLDNAGNPIGAATQLVSGGQSGQVTNVINSGSLKALLTLRDSQLPNMLDQLDTFASTVRDQVNAVQNSGSGYPGANSYTGTSSVFAGTTSNWSGSVQIAVLGANGQPATSPYPDEPNGVPALTLNLANLNTGQGAGNPSVQGIINEINQYYGAPQNKAEVGNLNDIRLASDSNNLPGSPAQFNFDFDLENTSSTSSNFYVTNVQVQDSNGNTISSGNSSIPVVNLTSYQTTQNSSVVTVNTQSPNNLTNGETVYLSDPGAIDGVTMGGGYYTITGVTSNSFQITGAGTGLTGGTFNASGQTATPPYDSVASGEATRTTGVGTISASLANNATSPYYTVTVNVGVDDGSGNIKTSRITYQVPNQQSNILNQRYAAQQVTGEGTLVQPDSSQSLATASLVDASGNTLPQVSGQYITNEAGFLKIAATNSSNVISINSLDSKQLGQTNSNPPKAATNRGFSSFFDLNDFFQSPDIGTTSDTVTNSALNLQVQQRLLNNPSLISTGVLTATIAGDGTYQRNAGDSTIVQKMADLGTAAVNFAASGGLSATQQTFNGYSGAIIGTAATNASNTQADNTAAQTLLTGFQQRESSISGVNLDEELANTVIYQNAYSASARVITVTNDLFTTLLQTFS